VTASRSSGLQSKNRPIFVFLSVFSVVLKLFTVFAVTVVSSNIFHFEIIRNENSRPTSSHLYCIDTITDHLGEKMNFSLERACFGEFLVL